MHNYFDITNSATNSLKNYIHILSVIRNPVGGIRTFIRYVYTNFNKANYHFTLLAPDLPELHVLLNDLKCFKIDFISIKKNPSDSYFFLSVSKAILGRKFDLVHSHGFASGLCSVLPSILAKTPHVMTSHDILQQNQFSAIKGFLKKKVLSLLFPMINVIHAVSHDSRANLIEFLPSLKKHNKVVVVPNGIEVERFKKPQKRDFRRELGIGKDAFLIGFLGRFMSLKGFHYLIQAINIIQKNSNLKKPFAVITFGWGGFIREEQKYIQEKGLQNYFYFLPFTPDVADAIKGLDVIAIPSLSETGPILPMEAMVSGVTVIGTNCIGLREVLEDTPAKIVPPKDSKALANAIIDEMSNPSVFQSQHFADKAAIRFDVKNQADKLEHIILNLIK